MSKKPVLRAGLCGIGLDAYWSQFAGLGERLKGYVAQVASRLTRPGVDVVNLGLIDTPARSRQAGHQCRREDIDVLFLYVTTYALSNTVLPVVQRAGVPVIVLNLQPEAAIDYEAFNKLNDRTAMTGEWLAFCSACPMPEIANLFTRAGIAFHQVTGVLDDAGTWREIEEWLAAARVRAALAEARLGLMGHYYSGMLDIMTDVTLLSIAFGVHAELLEVDELSALSAEVSESGIARRLEEFRAIFDVQPDCPAEELRRAARTSVALDAFVARHDLDAMAYYYKGSGNAANEDTMSSIILGTSLLTARRMAQGGAAHPHGADESRPSRGLAADGVRIHSVRLPGLVAHQEVVFGGEGETLTIRHDSLSRESFMGGVLLAIRRVPSLQGTTVGLESLLADSSVGQEPKG